MTKSPSSSAQAARERVAAQLRDIRLDVGISAHEVALRCGWSDSKSSRLEHAKAIPSDADIRAWCAACRAPQRAADLIAASREADQLYTEWRRKHRSGLRRTQEELLPLHERTRVQRVYCSKVIPGFFQTTRYATALLSAITRFQGTPDDVTAAVESRRKRERALYEGDHRFVVLLEETVLRYRIGGADIMAEQLTYLLEVMRLPSVALGVIPFTTDRHDMWPLEPFYIFDDERVIVETLTAEISITVPSEIRLYQRALREMGLMAAYGPPAKALIEAAITALG